MSDKITDKAGKPIVDKYGREICIGDVIMFPEVVHSKGGRGGMRFGIAIEFNRYLKYVYDKEMFDKWRDGQYAYAPGITAHTVVKVSERFMREWQDGTIFERF